MLAGAINLKCVAWGHLFEVCGLFGIDGVVKYRFESSSQFIRWPWALVESRKTKSESGACKQVGADRRLKYVLPLKYVLRLRYVRTSL